MFELVDDVESYPAFLPWCSRTELLQRDEQFTSARIHIKYKGIRISFATLNSKDKPQHMDIMLKEGPFKKLSGYWNFTALGDSGCKIDFCLNYEFSNRLLEKTLGVVFNYITSSSIESFIRRAKDVYGEK